MKQAFCNLKYLVKIIWRFDPKVYIFFFVSTLMGAMVPYIMVFAPKYILRAVLHKANMNEWIILVAFWGVGGILIHLLERIFTNNFENHLSALRNGCFGDMLSDKMLKMQYSLLEQPEIQNLCYRANMLFWSDFGGMAGTFTGVKVVFVSCIVIIGFTVILAQLHLALPFILTISVIVDAALMKQAKNKEVNLRPLLEREEREKNYLDMMMQDVIAGKDIRIYNLGNWLAEWYFRVTDKKEQIAGKVQKEYTKVHILSAIFTLFRDVSVYGYLIYAMGCKLIAVDDFLMYLSCVEGFSATLIRMIDNIQKIQQFLVYTNDFRSTMELPETEQGDSYSGAEDFKEIRMENVSFSYPGSEQKILSDICLRIQKGEHIAVVGANGAGKTTLIKLLVGLYEPESGKVEICGQDGKAIHTGSRLRMFSIVMQRIYQYAFTLLENITFTEAGTEEVQKVKTAIENSGLSEEIEKFSKGINTALRKEFVPEGIQLSGGQAQKLALARALYRNAPIVVLDEPTAAMDPIAEAEFYRNFRTIFQDKTCIFISHRLSSVISSDRIIVLQQGKAICSGTHEVLLAENEQYREMWEAQSRPYRTET